MTAPKTTKKQQRAIATAQRREARAKRKAAAVEALIAEQQDAERQVIQLARNFGGDVTSAQLRHGMGFKSAMLRLRQAGTFDYKEDENGCRYILLDSRALA